MAIISDNTNTTPMPLDSLLMQSPMLPKSILTSSPSTPVTDNINLTNSSPVPYFTSIPPNQIIGLVPVFPCCDTVNSIGGFGFCVRPGGYTFVYQLDVGGYTWGTFSVDSTSTANSVQVDIMALILPPINNVTVIKTTFSGIDSYFVTLYSSSITNGINVTCSVISTGGCGAGCSHIIYNTDINGGYENNLCGSPCDCRDGTYMADSIPNDKNFVLPVFASTTCNQELGFNVQSNYMNDKNYWLFSYPIGYDAINNNDFSLEVLINDAWTFVTYLNNNDYGIAYNNNFFPFGDNSCQNVNYQGYGLYWQTILSTFGEGTYRFSVQGSYSFNEFNIYCFKSPPFCLKEWDCILANGTVKFETEYSGGTFGSVTKQGESYTMCCVNKDAVGNITKNDTIGIDWNDSIRFYGFFGYEAVEFTRDFIKYATGVINKVRDEAIKNFTVKTDKLPMWLHQRFYAYGLQANRLFVNDYNTNNANYNYKHFWIVADSSYSPKYTNWSRYTKILDLKFKEGIQFTFKDNCC